MSSDSPRQSVFDKNRLIRVGQWLESQVVSNRLAGASVLVGQRECEAYFHATGTAGVNPPSTPINDASGAPSLRAFQRETIVRLYSMTKPVTSMAALMLYEQGHYQLDDPIAWYLPAFADMRVWTGNGNLTSSDELQRHTNALESPITVRQLMNHTAGFTYGFMNATPVDRYYREHELVFPGSPEPLASLVDRLAQAPLLCQPGTQWNYSVATDVLGRLVEVWSGQSLAAYLDNEVFKPLGMINTGFHVEETKTRHFADLYGPAAGGDLGAIGGNTSSSTAASGLPAQKVMPLEPPVALDVLASTAFVEPPALFSGGGGLVGCIDDYARFCQCLLNEGELDGVRLLGRKTVQYMRQNQLPGNRDMAAMGQAVWSESSYAGVGFGLGFAVVLDPVQAGVITSVGEHHWGGAASTFFWIDPVEKIYVILLTQLYPSSSYPLRTELRTAVYQALS